MEPFGWSGAGQAPYNNVIGIDPELTDPEAGDYRPAPGSPAEAYGCQSFAERRAPEPPSPGARRARREEARRDEIIVAGSIVEDTVWDADLVRVVGDVTIEDGVVLTIVPGARVQFEDYYRLTVAGALLAEGSADNRIVFTTDEPEAFTIDDSHAGCWNGIRFERTSSGNAASRLACCIVEYSKATGEEGGLHPYGGGALSVVDFSKLRIENCIFRSNVAAYGGAIFLYRQANAQLVGNLMVDNHALENGAAVYCAYSYPKLVNNTVTRNRIHNEDAPYIESCAVLNFIARPVFSNNIFRKNDPEAVYLHGQLWNNKDYYTHYNNIEDYAEPLGDNIDSDPLFVDPGQGAYQLGAGSPCIDAADNGAVPEGVETDLDGGPRFVDDPLTEDTGFGEPPLIDMGCYEYQPPTCPADITGDGVVDVLDLLAVLAAWGSSGGGGEDVTGDGVVDVLDLLEVLAAWGPCA